MNFEQLCRNCGFFPFTYETKKSISTYLGLSVRQVERYIKGAKIHPSAKRLLIIRSHGLIDLPNWKGFYIRYDALINPNGEQWLLSDLRSRSLTLSIKSK